MTAIETVAAPPGQECQHVEMTSDQETAFEAGRAASASAYVTAQLKAEAQTALDASDMTALRCLKSGVSFPSEWQTYVAALRSIIRSGTGVIPDRPAYPNGT